MIMVDNAGSIYPLIKTVELGIDMKIKLETQKTMKKYLLIKPSFLQSMPDASKIGFKDNGKENRY